MPASVVRVDAVHRVATARAANRTMNGESTQIAMSTMTTSGAVCPARSSRASEPAPPATAATRR